ncbi:hypothetical protein [Paraburkholderia azotifigens]|uniref:Uncharacterized protein n=1 Tax=Paraburkholderia azotifigens TaxID=2057004 RepID=A0ABU9RFG0_9BURK
MQMTTVLDPIRHRTILDDIDHICQMAGISKHFLTHSMMDVCQEQEVDWVRNFPMYRAKLAGLVLTNGNNVSNRMMYMAGALIRNFTDARVFPINTVLRLAKAGELPTPTVMMIPNLYVKAGGMKGIAAWDVQAIYDVLLERQAANKPTVIFIEDMDAATQAYGNVFRDFIENNYKIVG